MYSTVEDLGAAIASMDPTRLVVVEQSDQFPGELVFQTGSDQQAFYSRYKDWLSRHLILNALFNLEAFLDLLKRDGWEVILGSTCEPVLANHMRWSAPLHLRGIDLHPFQQYAMHRALESDFFFWNFSAGAGKSYCSAAGAQYLFDQGQVDLVVAFTLSKLKENLRRFFEGAGLDAVVNDGDKPKRHRGYQEGHQVYVANYEKAWVDFDELAVITDYRRVLWVLDECHKVVAEAGANKARKAIDRLAFQSQAKMWPMSATVVNGNPLRYRDVYSIGKLLRRPLGTKADFIERYAEKVNRREVRTRRGTQFTIVEYDWDLAKLHDIRHRVATHTMAIRKSDPGVRELFKGLEPLVVPVQMTDDERELEAGVMEYATDARDLGENLAPYYRILRTIATTPQALLHSTDEVAQDIAREYADVIARITTPSKIEVLNNHLESIREAGDKVVVFIHWTSLGLHLIKNLIGVPRVDHWGVGQSDKESQEAQDRFNTDPNITCFFTSDAGSHGLNMQVARYVIQLDPTYSPADAMQRASRIDRADSYLEGLTNYQFLVEDSVESRVWKVQQQRRQIDEAVQGTSESLDYGRAVLSEQENLEFLIFGQ